MILDDFYVIRCIELLLVGSRDHFVTGLTWPRPRLAGEANEFMMHFSWDGVQLGDPLREGPKQVVKVTTKVNMKYG